MICLADNTEHPTRAAMHKHLRIIRVKQEDYYREHHPKFDLFSGEPIPFHDAEQYLRTDFVDKFNIKKYIKQKPVEAKAWAIDWLRRRREEKGLVYAPTHAELRSLPCPTVRYYNSVGGYNKICSELGYKIRFDKALNFKPLPVGAMVYQDTREQRPLALAVPIMVKTLKFGDYAMEGSKLYIERKSLQDFVGTLTSRAKVLDSNKKNGPERLRAELTRAREAGGYVVMIVESEIGDALGFNFLPQMRHTKSRPEHVFKNLRDLLVDFADCFQVVFVKGRYEAASILLRLYEAGESVKGVDLQFAYEEGLLTNTEKVL